ncbi:MAG: hypothetical protein IJY76_07145 [Anaerotignum sp.]|nr:hypothetical protein [Anaerotignum sp.]
MKKWMKLMCLLTLIATSTACSKPEEDILHLGLNAEITEIDAENYALHVKGADEDSEVVFGGNSVLDCSKAVESQNIIYVDYADESVTLIEFEDLQIGDAVILNIYESELNGSDNESIVVEQIQLATQRY